MQMARRACLLIRFCLLCADRDAYLPVAGPWLHTDQPCSCRVQGMCYHYVFVSSAGAYKANDTEPMHVEGDARKGSAGGGATRALSARHL
jgi:hypothetical protein